METTFTKSSDTVNKIKLESHLIYALWTFKRAHAGQEAEFEVHTLLVGNGAKIKITCKIDSGKKLDKVEGTIFNNYYYGKVLVPENCKPDEMIFFEAELPKHGLKEESNSIPVRPVIKVSKLQWDKTQVNRKDDVTLTCQFESGVEEGDDATIVIYEHNPNSSDLKVVSIPTIIYNNKIEVLWEFDYQDDTLQIPTDPEMQPYKKNYHNPDFYFMVVVDGVKIGEKRESGLLKFKDWLEIELDNPDNADRKYTLTFPDGSTRIGQLDKNGQLHEENIPPGPCSIEIEDSTDTNTSSSQTTDNNSYGEDEDNGSSENTDDNVTDNVHVVRLIGLTFDSNKCFLLPYALPGIKGIIAMHNRFENAQVLIVGHDGGDEELKSVDLACCRAEILGAYLTNNVDAWQKWFGADKPVKIRWGTREVQLMLSCLPEGEMPFFLGTASGVTDTKTKDAIKKFQAYCNSNLGGKLKVDGIAGPKTQKEILKAYMGIEDTTLSTDIVPMSHGCEGQFEDDLTLAGMQPDERIIEVFFFENKIYPMPQKKTSLDGSTEYFDWKKMVVETKNYEYHGIHVQVIDKKKMPVKNAKVILEGPNKCESFTDNQGFAFFSGLVKGTYSVRAEKIGIEIESSSITYPTAKTLSRSVPVSKK